MSAYAYTRRRTPATGELIMDGNRWAASPAPMAEVVAMTLRTQAGSCAVDPDLGVDWRKLSKLGTGVVALAETTIASGLQRYVRAGLIAALAVSARVDAGRLLYEVSFRDPRSGSPSRITGAV